MARKQSTHEYPLSYVAREFQNILAEMVQEYADELNPKVNEITRQVAEDFASSLKTVTPRSSAAGQHLADTVEVSKEKERYYGKTTQTYVVHFGKWQIAHLLEFGWTAKNGKRVERQAFVRPLFDRNKERYVKMYRDGLNK